MNLTHHLDARANRSGCRISWKRLSGALVLASTARPLLRSIGSARQDRRGGNRGEARATPANYARLAADKADEGGREACHGRKFKGALPAGAGMAQPPAPQARSTKLRKPGIHGSRAMREAATRQGQGPLSLSTAAGGIGKRAINRPRTCPSTYRAGTLRPLLREFQLRSARSRFGIIGPTLSAIPSLLRSDRRPAAGEAAALELGSTVQLATSHQQARGLGAVRLAWPQSDSSTSRRRPARSILGGVQVSAHPSCWRLFCSAPQQHSPIARSRAGGGDGSISAAC